MDSFQGVLEASPDAVLLVDQEGVIRQTNRNVQKVLGYPPQELEDKVVEDLLRKEDRQHHVQLRDEYMENPEPRPMGSELDLYAVQKDGTDVPVEISLGPIERGGDLYVVVTIADITDRKEYERNLQRQNERLDEFASIVSHDLQSPLRIVEGQLELAREECDSEHLDSAEDALERSQALIDDLLTLARQGDEVDETEPVEIAEVAKISWQTVETAQATLDASGQGIIKADRSRLQQLLENLYRNSVEHGGEDVTVSVGEMSNGFYVRDTGAGIPESEREEIFEAGYSTNEEGTGLGLRIAEQIADAHGWETTVTESEQGGAQFEFTGVERMD